MFFIQNHIWLKPMKGKCPMIFIFIIIIIIWVLQPFQEYFIYIVLIVHPRWLKTGVPEKKKHLTFHKQNH